MERVIVAPRHEGGDDVVDIVRLATACGVRVAVLPRLLEVIGTSVEFDDLGGRLLLGVRGFGLTPSSRLLKRAFDIVVATALLILILPVLVTIALAVKLTSRGPVLFKQTRVGRHGRQFQMLKYRTMVADAESRKGSYWSKTRRRRCSRSPTIRGRPGWAGSCGATRSTSYRSCSACCAVT